MTYHIIAQVIFVHNEWTLNPAPSPRAPHLEKTRRRRQIREKEALARCLVFYGAADDVVAGEERASRRRANGRHDLYGRYMDEFATLFAEALKSDKVDYAKLIGAFVKACRASCRGWYSAAQRANIRARPDRCRLRTVSFNPRSVTLRP